MKTKNKVGLAERLDFSLILSNIIAMSKVLVDKVNDTDWIDFTVTHEFAIRTLATRFGEIYKDDMESLNLADFIFEITLRNKLDELGKFIFGWRNRDLKHKVLIAQTQATIITWKQQLERILLIIEAEQKKPRRHQKTKP